LINQFDTLNDRILTCTKCPRLVAWREQVGREKRRAFRDEDYWAKPVTGFGDPHARVLVVGLAPGAHGSNRTGRMFTGDDSGRFLYAALHRAGFANQAESKNREDGLVLQDVYITALCRCVPPGNRPTPQEIKHCSPFLESELKLLDQLQGVVALGKLAYDYVEKLLDPGDHNWKPPVFGHGVFYRYASQTPWLLASYHPSRQNTQTGRLTQAMFDQIWEKVNQVLRS
jgi:uracil-DNA glycosylase family 4